MLDEKAPDIGTPVTELLKYVGRNGISYARFQDLGRSGEHTIAEQVFAC